MSSGSNISSAEPSGDKPAVRPLDKPAPPQSRPPRLTVVAALLAIGGLLGWGAASAGSQTESTPTSAPIDISPIGDPTIVATATPTVVWSQSTTVPPIPTGMEYNGFSDAVELDGVTYIVVNFVNTTTGATASELWNSVDGTTWESVSLWLGEPVTALQLTVFGDSLLLTGDTSSGIGLWRSLADRAIGGTSWNRLSLQAPAGLRTSFHSTAVSAQNEIIVSVFGLLDIAGRIIEPYLPDGVVADNTQYYYGGDEFVYDREGNAPIQILAEAPEILLGSDNVWIRLITLAGEEVLQTIPLPAGVYAVDPAPALNEVAVAMVWRSDDGVDFVPVTTRNALPEGISLPEPWRNGFVAAVYERPYSFAGNQQVALWGSNSGRAWQAEEQQPPIRCSPYVLAVSGDRLALSSEDGTMCVRDADTDWQVLTQSVPITYVVGGDAGFLGYPNSFDYSSALFSRDGVTWAEIANPSAEPYPTLAILQDRLLALSVNRPRANVPTQIDIWVGEIDG